MKSLSHPKELKKIKAAEKFGSLFNQCNAIVPDELVVQQASSHITAEYTASLIKGSNIVADLTAGLGINTFSFASVAKEVFAVEKSSSRADALENNVALLGMDNVRVVCGECESWLNSIDFKLDAVFIDPARRADTGRKLITLEDCSPNVKALMPRLKQLTNRVLIKASPLLDLQKVMKELNDVVGFSVIEVAREVKELLIDIEFDKEISKEPYLHCVFLSENEEPGIIKLDYSDRSVTGYLSGKGSLAPGNYLYEPSASLMKCGRFGYLQRQFPGLEKLAPNTHLFHAEELYETFPGRKLQIKGFVSSKDLKKMKGGRYNVISRNHPAKASEIESRFHFKSSGSDYLVACTVGNDKIILLTEEI